MSIFGVVHVVMKIVMSDCNPIVPLCFLCIIRIDWVDYSQPEKPSGREDVE